jgi:translation elongation factor EF-1alpha
MLYFIGTWNKQQILPHHLDKLMPKHRRCGLGILKQGTIKIHDELILFPQKKKVTVKSIQMHDKNVEESYSSARVGLALTGVSFDGLARGDILSNINHFISADQELIMDSIRCHFIRMIF